MDHQSLCVAAAIRSSLSVVFGETLFLIICKATAEWIAAIIVVVGAYTIHRNNSSFDFGFWRACARLFYSFSNNKVFVSAQRMFVFFFIFFSCCFCMNISTLLYAHIIVNERERECVMESQIATETHTNSVWILFTGNCHRFDSRPVSESNANWRFSMTTKLKFRMSGWDDANVCHECNTFCRFCWFHFRNENCFKSLVERTHLQELNPGM